MILAATGGTARHAMVVDEQLRPLFAFLRAIPAPTSLFAAPEDWGSADLGERIARAATELALLVRSGVAARHRRRQLGRLPAPVRRQRDPGRATVDDVDFDTDLMRLAAGGSADPT